MATPAISAERPEIRLSGKRIRWGEVLIKGLLALCALVSIATTTGIVIALLEPAIEFFREVSIVDYLTGTEWSPLFEPPSFGVIPLVVGTLSVTFWACLVAMPFGLGSAIYLSEYARPAHAADPEAGARGTGRDPDRGLRLLRADVLHARSCATSASRRRSSTPSRRASSSA